MTIAKLSIATVGAALFSLGTVVAAQATTVILESAAFAPSQVSPIAGYGIFATQDIDQFLGWRFQLDSTLKITDVGGYLVSNNSSPTNSDQIFVAIVSLISPTALPQGSPFLPGEVIAKTTFIPPSFLSPILGDVTAPLSVTLNPGSYALIFGSGLFGATGSADALFNFGNFPDSSYLAWGRAPIGASIRTGWYDYPPAFRCKVFS